MRRFISGFGLLLVLLCAHASTATLTVSNVAITDEEAQILTANVSGTGTTSNVLFREDLAGGANCSTHSTGNVAAFFISRTFAHGIQLPGILCAQHPHADFLRQQDSDPVLNSPWQRMA